MALHTKIKVLVITSNPDDSSNIRTDRIFEGIKSGIQAAEQSQNISVEIVAASSINKFIEAVEKHRPNIIHMIGHGIQYSPFVFETKDGNRQYIEDVEKIADHLENYIGEISAVIITACHSYELARKIKSIGINAVIGIDGQLDKDDAKIFSEKLYFFIASGNNLKDVMHKTHSALNATNKIDLQRLPDLILPAELDMILFDPGNFSIAERLKRGSKKYYEKFANQNDLIFTDTILIDLINKEYTLESLLNNCWRNEKRSLLLTGEKGKGKTQTCLKIWEQYNKNLNTPTVLYIPCAVLEKDYKSHSDDKIILSFLFEKYLETIFPTDELFQQLYEEFISSSDTTIPSYLLVIDGFTDLSETKLKVLKNIQSFWIKKEAGSVQVVLTSHYNMKDAENPLEEMESYSLLELVPKDNQETASNAPQTQSERNQEIDVYVITSIWPQIEEKYKDRRRILNNIPSGRYHSTTIFSWRPYKNQATIKEILEEMKQWQPIPFNDKYVNSSVSDNDHFVLRENLHNTIGVIDLLGLNVNNRAIARLFDLPSDTHDIGGVITPICVEIKDEQVREEIRKERNDVLKNQEIIFGIRYNFIQDFYGRDNPDLNAFKNKLAAILSNFKPRSSRIIQRSDREKQEYLEKYNFQN